MLCELSGLPGWSAQVYRDRERMFQGGPGYDPAGQPHSRSPGEEGLEAFDKRLKAGGGSREVASCEVINRLVCGAIRGDERALVKPWTPEQLGRNS